MGTLGLSWRKSAEGSMPMIDSHSDGTSSPAAFADSGAGWRVRLPEVLTTLADPRRAANRGAARLRVAAISEVFQYWRTRAAFGVIGVLTV